MTREEYLEAVEARIKEWFEACTQEAPTDRAKQMIERTQSLVMRGGKRARPDLLYLAYSGYGGSKAENIVDLGAALELFHQYLLMHDDVMDKDDIRYGGPNIIGMYADEGRDIAESMGILVGDLVFTYVNQIILQTEGVDNAHRHEILALLHEINADEMFGQQLDIFNLLRNIDQFDEESLVRIHEFKTSRYTTQLPMLVAAAVLELPEGEREQIRAFGRSFGIAYQLADDYVDYFGRETDPKDKGHQFRDYRQAKVTHPIFLGLTKGDEYQVSLLRQNLGNKQASDEDVTKVLAVLEQCGAKQASKDFALRYHDEAVKLLDQLAVSEDGKRSIGNLLAKFRI